MKIKTANPICHQNIAGALKCLQFIFNSYTFVHLIYINIDVGESLHSKLAVFPVSALVKQDRLL